MKTYLNLTVLMASAAVAIAGCGKPASNNTSSSAGNPGEAGSITVTGSTTVLPLSQAWAENFMKIAGNPSVSVSSGGSGVGITALINGTTDIAQSSRAMKSEEIAQAKAKGFSPVETTVAKDGLSVIVNKANPVAKLTIPQLSGIFTGKISDWEQVGGRPGRITIVSRDKSSGSYDFFLGHVLRQGNEKDISIQFAPAAQQQQSNQAIVAEVSRNPDGIGYVGLGYIHGPGIKTVAVAKTAAEKFVTPSMESVLAGTYPIARPLYYYTHGEPSGAVKQFLDYALSADGQAVVARLDYVPVKK
jgi:phosphate transport system substrate-binding protein